jgi:hypothetical protein
MLSCALLTIRIARGCQGVVALVSQTNDAAAGSTDYLEVTALGRWLFVTVSWASQVAAGSYGAGGA